MEELKIVAEMHSCNLCSNCSLVFTTRLCEVREPNKKLLRGRNGQ